MLRNAELREMPAPRGLKDRIWGWCDHIPLIKETADPIVATVLSLVIVLTAMGLSFPGQIFPHDNAARSHVLQVAGGLVLIFGAYYASVNLREVRAQQYLERLARVIDQVGSPSEPVRLGSIRLLQGALLARPALPADSMSAKTAEARRLAMLEVLKAISREGDTPAACLADDVLKELRQDGFSADRSFRHGVRCCVYSTRSSDIRPPRSRAERFDLRSVGSTNSHDFQDDCSRTSS